MLLPTGRAFGRVFFLQHEDDTMSHAKRLIKELRALTDEQFQEYLDTMGLMTTDIDTNVLAINMAEINRRSVKPHRHG